MGKGHAAVGLFPILAEYGYIDRATLDGYTRLGNPLGDHPDMRKVPGIDFSSGSIGHALSAGAGMGYEATMYLLERGVRLTGTDAWSWDAPFVHTAKKYGETQDASLIWEGHKAGRDIGYCHIEKLHNLEVLPPTGFFISCFPHKIRGASAGWTRAVAIFDDALMASV